MENDKIYFGEIIDKYKKVATEVTESYSIYRGFIGSSPEIYEKINHEKAKGVICFFTIAKGNEIRT